MKFSQLNKTFLGTLLIAVFITIPSLSHAQKPIYLDSKQPVEIRVDDLLKRMTLQDKIAQMCQYVGIEHQMQAYKESKGSNISINDDAKSFYKGISFDSLRNMIKEGKTGSFLHVVTSKEANELQKLAMQSKLKIPLLIGIDAIHGNALVSGTTVFPTPLGLASSWNLEMVKQTQVITAREMRATGSQWTFTPNIDIARDARWGRVGETFGEDSYLVGMMGAAFVKGLQGDNLGDSPNSVLSCIKHLIGGGQSINGLNAAPTDISERTLWEQHLPPYKMGVEAGAFSVMTAHNELNGVPCHSNKYLMNEILREKWGFKGFYVSDWMDIERLATMHKVADNQKEAVYQTVMAGMDMHMHGPEFMEPLMELVKEGRVPEAVVTAAAKRILEVKFKLGLFEKPFVDEKSAEKIVFNKEGQQLALEAARQSIILLKNDRKVLPIQNNIKRILVTGPNADNQTTLGDWSLLQPDQNVVTILEGLRNEAPLGTLVDYVATGTVKQISAEQINAAAIAAKEADLTVVVVGENSLRYQNKEKTSGENIDRDDIQLIGQQNQLVQALLASGKPVVIVLVNSRPLAITNLTEKAAAIIEAWEPGNLGGKALAEILFGKVNPSAKLTITIPRSTGQIPTYYNMKPSNYFHKYIQTKSEALYHFGYGLSYTKYTYSDLKLSASQIDKMDGVSVSINVRNTGDKDGDEIVQLYINDVVSQVTRPIKELKAFKRISLKAGESKTVTFQLTAEDFKHFDLNMKWITEPGDFKIMVGGSSRDMDLLTTTLNIK